MNRRELLRKTGVVTAGATSVTMAGCSSLPFLGCGPGEDAVEDVAARLEEEPPQDGSTETPSPVSLKGTIESFSRTEVVIDDTTGRALLLAIGGFEMQNIEGGECAYATGYPTPADDEPDADIGLLVTDVGLDE